MGGTAPAAAVALTRDDDPNVFQGLIKLKKMKQNQHTRELINARKTSLKHNNKDLSRLRLR